MTATAKLGLELLANAAANQTLANTTFAQLNQLVQASAIARLDTPPGSPANEALYIITATATGVWVGKENQLAYWLTSTGAWQYITPREGMLIHVDGEDVYYKYTGSAWSVYSMPDNSVTNTKLADMATQTIKGRTTAGTGDPEDLTASQARGVLGLATTDSPTLTALTLTNGQIVFPATQVPSANPNTLDDYEEGTWTPTPTFATPGDLVVVTSVNSGFYTKNGRECKISFTLATSTFTHTTASGVLMFNGIPFTSLNATGNTSMGGTSWQGITKAGFTDAAALVSANSNNVQMFMSRSGGGRDQVVAADMPSGGSVIVQATIMYTI